jgi:hypothetical protein
VIAISTIGVVGLGALLATVLQPQDTPQAVASDQCRKAVLNDWTGAIRDKGMIPCNDVNADNSRTKLIRDGFVRH